MDDGCSLRDHYKSHARQTGQPHPTLLNAPQLPYSAEHLWRMFRELRNQHGAERITAEHLKNYQWVTGEELDLWERQAMIRLESTFHEHLSKQQ